MWIDLALALLALLPMLFTRSAPAKAAIRD
jgi:hypothetical protein